LMEWIQAELGKFGAKLDAWYVCPHHPTTGSAPLVVDCECRKPKPGLFLQAIRELDIDVLSSFAIGDKARDIEAGARAGVHSELFIGGSLLDFIVKAESRLIRVSRADGT